MPRKTREEKILARLHRLERTAPTLESNANEPTAVKEKKASGVRLEEAHVNIPLPIATRSNERTDYSFVLTDLRKTLFLTAAAVLIEVVLSYILHFKHIL
ncbi:MAG: hypothetical protein A3F35_02295 [Candidatus Woykebacteria bacterium RIFCSPHIGHO2_12_FULL_45_10]|uniref:Uncharacterized protein n=1 Tax=Candidatus Woykebacteria bacterium RIFCSPHIGHO2_12_FULL_45_10 TaxID=1802603 RepID=A0A1G1WNM1_9BACT|nr:MAG: hypothetical protein A3F35_02295 [Candidatus Woykebacteria bacterium RIFCSPHIGHO2_12_FULL_45_10]